MMPGPGTARDPVLMALADRSDTSRPEPGYTRLGVHRRRVTLQKRRRGEASVEYADWLESGFDAAEARFLMLTAITHHRFGSPIWGEDAVRSLHAELAEIETAAVRGSGTSR